MTRKVQIGLLLFALAGCAKGHVQTTETTATGVLPRPTEIAVLDFAISPADVQLDQHVGPSLLGGQNGLPPEVQRQQIAQNAREALAETLTEKLRGFGLPAMRETASKAPSAGMLLVQGQILSIDLGSKRRRLLIGLGAGKSSAEANAQIYYVANSAQPELLQAFSGNSDSGHMPGAAETMGAGAAAGQIATSAAMTAATHAGSALHGTEEAQDADHLAEALAKQIAQYAVGKGWIPASAVQRTGGTDCSDGGCDRD